MSCGRQLQRVASLRACGHLPAYPLLTLRRAADPSRRQEDVSGWDVSQVTNMLGTFDECVRFNSDLRSWDVSQVTNMEQMFRMPRGEAQRTLNQQMPPTATHARVRPTTPSRVHSVLQPGHQRLGRQQRGHRLP